MRSLRPTRILAAAFALCVSALSFAAAPPGVESFTASAAAQSVVAVEKAQPIAVYAALPAMEAIVRDESILASIARPDTSLSARTRPESPGTKTASYLRDHVASLAYPPSGRSWRHISS